VVAGNLELLLFNIVSVASIRALDIQPGPPLDMILAHKINGEVAIKQLSN